MLFYLAKNKQNPLLQQAEIGRSKFADISLPNLDQIYGKPI